MQVGYLAFINEGLCVCLPCFMNYFITWWCPFVLHAHFLQTTNRIECCVRRVTIAAAEIKVAAGLAEWLGDT